MVTLTIITLFFKEACLVFAVPASWFYLIFFCGAVKLTGPFVTMIYAMIMGDMFTFSIIYIIFLFGFTQAFYFVLKSVEEPGLYNWYHTSWVAMFHMTLGEYDYEMFNDTAYPDMAKIIFVLFQILIPILLFNMLIAMMGNTYATVNEKSEKEFLKMVIYT
jgi:transient receptor potential cation channel subfamily V protein 6